MESKFKVGDLVWAKMKGFPAWPAKLIEPKEEVRRPSDKKPKKFVYFFGSENYAWIPQDCLWQYVTNKERFTLTHRIPRGFREAMEAVDDALKNLPEQGSIKTADLPSIDEELRMMGAGDRSNTSVRHTYSGSKAKKYLQMQGRKSLRQVGSPTPPSVPEKQSPKVAKVQHRVTSRRDRALKRRASVDAKDRQPTKRRRSQPVQAQESAPSRKSRSIGGATSRARARRKQVDASGDSGTVGEEEEEEEEDEDEEVVLKRPNGGGDYLGGEEENGDVTPKEGSVTSEESEVTLRKPEGDDVVTHEDDDADTDVDEVTLRKPDAGGDSDVDTKWDNGIEGESVEIGVSSSEGKIDVGGQESFTDDIGVEVVTEEVIEWTENYDLSGGNEVVETTEDTVTVGSTEDVENCDEQQTVADESADECDEQQVEECVSTETVEVERSSATDVMQEIMASTIVRRTASVDTDITEASIKSSAAGGSSCGTEEKEKADSDKEEVAPSDDEKPHPKLRSRQEKEIKDIKDTMTPKERKEEAKLKRIQDRKSREFQAAIRTKPPVRKRPLSSSPLSISSTITPKRSKTVPTKPLSSSSRKANSTAQNDLKPILEMMQQQSGKIARLSDTEDQDAREDDYADRLADLSGIDFSLPNLPRTKNIIATPMKIGFLGLGAMGSGMVTNLLNSGHEVTVWNRTPSSCREFVKIGALKGNSPSEVITSCDMTFSCVSDPSALKDLVFGNCGVLQGIGPGKAYIDMSTVDVETITDVHEAVTTRGGRFLEAPVIGSRQPAMNGQLLILAAGDRTLFDDCYSCLEAMGRQTFFLGEVGSATKMKLVISMLMGTVLAGLAESMALAEHIGLDQEEVLKILTLSPVSCPLVRTKGHAMMQAQFSNPHCRLHLCQKDLRLAVNMSDTVEQPLHVASAVNELFKKAKAKGYGEHDSAAVYRAADL